MTLLQPGQKYRAIFEISAPAQQQQLKPVSTEARQLLWDKSLYPPPRCVSNITAMPVRAPPPDSGHQLVCSHQDHMEINQCDHKGHHLVPCGHPTFAPATVFSLPDGSPAPEGDEQTIWSLQGRWLAARASSPSPTRVVLGCIQHLMTVWSRCGALPRSKGSGFGGTHLRNPSAATSEGQHRLQGQPWAPCMYR